MGTLISLMGLLLIFIFSAFSIRFFYVAVNIFINRRELQNKYEVKVYIHDSVMMCIAFVVVFLSIATAAWTFMLKPFGPF